MRRSVFSFAERTSQCYIRQLLQIGARDFFPVLRRGVTECQYDLSGLVHELSGFGEALRQRDCQVIPAAADTAYVFQGEHAAQGSGDHTLMDLWDTLRQIPDEMNAGEITKRTFRCDADIRSPEAGDETPL